MPEKCNCINCKKEFEVESYKKETDKICSSECLSDNKEANHRGEWIEKICPSCGNKFISLKSRNKKYCSDKCNKERNEKYMMYNCDICGKEMRIKKDIYQNLLDGKRKSITCSLKCSNLTKRTGHDVECDYCGKIFYRRQYHIDRQEHKFCTQECQIKYLHKERFEIRKCEICQKEFECSKLSTQRFCSNECNGEWQKTLFGENNPQFTRKKMLCGYCGKEHYVKLNRLDKQKNFFCSNKCRQDWYANIHSQTKEYRDKKRMDAVKILESGVISKTNSKPQQLVDLILDKNNIKYEREKGFKYYCVDNLLENNLIIEVQGDYWHCNPIVFKNISETQYKRISRDKAKHTYIKGQTGKEILYIWESDIYNSLEKCEKLILEYIKRNGDLENYHSFNYYIDKDDNLKLCDNIVIPYQEQNCKDYKKLLKVS